MPGVGPVLVLECEEDSTCEECGARAETRPYGKGGSRICITCGMKPENREQVESAFNALLDGCATAEVNE